MIIKIVTLVFMATFYICYFAKMLSQRRQGIKTDQLGKGKEGFVKFIEVTLKIATYLLPLFQIVSILFYGGKVHMALRIAGIILCLATGFASVFFHLQIVKVEEDFLMEAFGEEYLQYKKKVCRYIGRK